jgi:hypothetical protein
MSNHASMDMDTAFEFVEEMLYGIAWDFTRRYRLSFDEVKSEVFWAFMLAARKFDGDRGMKFSTWITFKVTRYMRGWIKERFTDRLSFVEEVREDALGPVAIAKDWLEEVKGLSGDAREMLALLFDISDHEKTPARIAAELKREIGFEKGFDKVEQEITLQELRSKFQK